MHLQESKVELFLGPVPGGGSPGTHVQLKALLSCPVCGESHEIETASRHIGNGPFESLQPDIDQLVASRSCDKCGVVSAFPLADRERFQRDLEQQITSEWLEEEGRKLIRNSA
jgi:hypothetical protein